jgi:transcriptional regulator with XRE-family HTH domain
MPKPPTKSTTAARDSLPPAPSEHEEKILQVLKNLLKTTGYSYRKAEAALGLSRGTLSRLFKGTRPLKVSHITGICRLAGLDSGEFFPLVYLRRSSSLLSTDPEPPSAPALPKPPALVSDNLFEPHPLNRFLRVSRAEREEVQELLRVVCSSLSTARWVLWWLEDEARRRNLRAALRASLGLGGSGGCVDPNG